jgi:hypothetical protein
VTAEKKRGASAREHLQLLAKLVRADGCTAAPDFWFKDCCDEHDVYYRTGRDGEGCPITRREADRRLYTCLKGQALTPIGRFLLSPLYYTAVRLFGARHWKGESHEAQANEPA